MSGRELMRLFCAYGARRYNSLNGPHARMTSDAWRSGDLFLQSIQFHPLQDNTRWQGRFRPSP